MNISQKSQPAAAFRSCCGRRTQLNHARNCPTLAPKLAPVPETAKPSRDLVVTRKGGKVTWARDGKTGTITFRIVSAAKQCEARLRQPDGHAKLDEIQNQMRAGLWS